MAGTTVPLAAAFAIACEDISVIAVVACWAMSTPATDEMLRHMSDPWA